MTTNETRQILPKNWQMSKLGDLCSIKGGDSAPQDPAAFSREGIPFVRMQDVGRYHHTANLVDTQDRVDIQVGESLGLTMYPRGSILLPRSGSVYLNHRAILGADAYVVSHLAVLIPTNPNVIAEYLYYLLCQVDMRRWAAKTTGLDSISFGSLKSINVPLPPLIIQERIVQILAKVDDISAKQVECSSLLKGLSSLLFESFTSDPQTKNASVNKLIGSVLLEEPANGKSPSRKNVRASAQVLTLTAIRNGILNPEQKKLADFEVADVSKYYVKKNDCYVVRGNGNIDLLGRMGLYDGEDIEMVYPDTMIRLRFDNRIVLNEFIQFLWDTRLVREQILRKAKTSNGTHKINQEDVKRIEFPCPPIGMQQKFLMTAQAYFQGLNRQSAACDSTDAAFSSLLARAFTGELTAEWESVNADWISEQTALYSRLPQLTLLALLARRSQEASSVSELMNHCFQVQTEGVSRSMLYVFAPSQNGPFSEQLVADLEDLQEQDLVTVEQTPDEDAKVTIADAARVDQMLQDLPEDLQLDIETTLESYGGLDAEGLLSMIAEKYPAYVRKNRARRR